MNDISDPTRQWTREVAHLRAQAQKLRRRPADPASTELMEAALSNCDSMLRDLAGAHLLCDRLRTEVRVEAAAWERLFDAMPAACLLTDCGGVILNANAAAGVLLNVTAKRLKDRQLLVFSEDREAFATLLQRLGRGADQIRTRLAIRPRERKPAEIHATVVPMSQELCAVWIWFLIPAGESTTAIREDLLPASALVSAAG